MTAPNSKSNSNPSPGPDDFRNELLLQLGRVPPAASGARERALHRATIALRQAPDADSKAASEHGHPPENGMNAGAGLWSIWIGSARAVAGMAVAALMIYALLVMAPSTPDAARPSLSLSKAAQLNLIAEMEHTFPGILKAVELRGGDVNVQLLPEPGPAETSMAQAVSVTLRTGGGSMSAQAVETQILTYSGQRICVRLKALEGSSDETLCFTALISGDGNVFVMTDDGVSDPRTGELQTRGVVVAAVRLKEETVQ